MTLSRLVPVLVTVLATFVGPDAPVTALPAVPPAAPATARPAAPPEVPAVDAGGAFLLPVDPPAVVLTPFRPPDHRYGAGHRGVDLAAQPGAAVRAAAGGTVIYAGVLAGRGVVSVLHSGGLRTTYEPVTPVVRAGDRISGGQLLGAVAVGHLSCAPVVCLHWGARLPDGSYLDPMSLIRGWRVRLLPWDG